MTSGMLVVIAAAASLGAQSASKARIAATIRADVAEVIAGNRDGLKRGFAATPSWDVSLIDETVDVSDNGDMAVYRSTYNQDSVANGFR